MIVRNRKIFVQENVSFTPIVRKSTIGAISYNNIVVRKTDEMEKKGEAVKMKFYPGNSDLWNDTWMNYGIVTDIRTVK